jgi:TPR repeat protein
MCPGGSAAASPALCIAHIRQNRNQMEDLAELIRWWDVLEVLAWPWASDKDVVEALLKAGEIAHPDAQWLAALFPAPARVSPWGRADVMRQQVDDPRALHLLWAWTGGSASELLTRAAVMGYAPAQAQLSMDGEDSFPWARRSAAKGFRGGLYALGFCYDTARGCARDMAKAAELYGQAAALGMPQAVFRYGETFGEHDYRRYECWARSKKCAFFLRDYVIELLPLFEEGRLGRVLHTAASVFNAHLDFGAHRLYEEQLTEQQEANLRRVLQLHAAMLERAREALLCWGLVGTRLGVVTDVRVVITRMAWHEPWRWGEKDEPETIMDVPPYDEDDASE